MYNPETALGTIQRTKTNKTKGEIKNVQTRDSIGHNTKNKDKQNKRGKQECTIQRQHWAQYKEQRQTKQKGGNQECTIQRQHWAQYKEQRQTKQKG
jgi:hypothetical protein